MATQPLIINNFQRGMADSPHVGFGLMRNVEIEHFPGAVQANNKPASMFPTAVSAVTFTAATSDLCTIASGTFDTTGTPVTLTTTGTLPAGLSASTNYFVIFQSATTFELATTIANANAGTQIDITDTGTGTHSITTVDPGTVKHWVQDPNNDNKFCIDSNGRVWYTQDDVNMKLLNGNTLTNSNGNGLEISPFSSTTKTWLFVFRNALIDVIDVFGTTKLETPSWANNGWQTMNAGAGSNNSHHAKFAQDNIIYYCDDRYIGSIKEASGQTFDPSSGSTFTFSVKALDTPPNEILNWLEEYGVDLLAAGDNFGKIYPWDRVSDSFRLPINVPETAVKKIQDVNGTIYILAGTSGNIYSTTGVFVKHEVKLPHHVVNNTSTLRANIVDWGGIGARNGALIFGVDGVSTPSEGAWLLYPGGRLIVDNQPIGGAGSATSFLVNNDYYFFGYASGADVITITRYSANEGRVESPFFKVGTKTKPAIFSTLEVQTAKVASAGQIKIGYREDLTASFTSLATYNAASGVQSFTTDNIGLIDIENIQIEIQIDEDMIVTEVRLF